MYICCGGGIAAEHILVGRELDLGAMGLIRLLDLVRKILTIDNGRCKQGNRCNDNGTLCDLYGKIYITR